MEILKNIDSWDRHCWYPETVSAQINKSNWFDFKYIPGANQRFFKRNKESVKFFEDNLQQDDIVMTHMLPSWKSVAEQYKFETSNCFFVCDMEKLILERQPRLWIHGHGHSSFNYNIGNTKIIANPRGYKMLYKQENLIFNQDLVIDI